MSQYEYEQISATRHASPSGMQPWLQKASNNVEILQGDREQGEAVLHQLRVSPESLLGKVALETGGILIDHGWIRFLGSGCAQMQGNLLNWNTTKDSTGLPGAFFVAYDVIGGFFAINGGVLPDEKVGTILYWGPDTLEWHSLGGSYAQLFNWAITADLNQRYHTMRWSGWQAEVANLDYDQGFSIMPFLWAQADLSMAERSRRAVPMTELWGLQQELARQIQH